MPNLTNKIINRVIELQSMELQSAVIHQARRCLLDYAGVTIAGSRIKQEKKNKYINKISIYQKKKTKFFGMDFFSDVYSTALINGINSHELELDDGHRFGMMHPGGPVITAVLSVAVLNIDSSEIKRNIFEDDNYKRIIRAIIIGYEIAIELALNMQPGHKLKGYHATATCGTVGAAIAAAVIMGQDTKQLHSTISAAVTSASGLLEMIDNTSELKPYNIGQAAVNGIMAANIGSVGYTGPIDPIGGDRGFYSALATKEDFKKIKNKGLFENSVPHIMGIYTKAYAACRHSHPAVEAILNIRKNIDKNHLEVTNVKRVIVKTYELAIAGHNHKVIENINSAKMSMPYSIATALLYGLYNHNAYTDELIADKNINKLMEKIELKIDPGLDVLSPKKRAAIVELELLDGSIYSNQVDYPLGEPENPMTDKEMLAKFTELARFAEIDANEIKSIKKNMMSIVHD